MATVSADLVDIVRDYAAAHTAMRRLFERYRCGELRFEELEQIISDDERSALFRLKEKCHALFRPKDAGSILKTRREVLFDLAVGSLFHEAMKFRESFYQQEIYGPRVRVLRSESADDSGSFLREFEKILAGVSDRLEEGLQETEILIEQTGQQLRDLIAEHPENDMALRYLVENPELVEDVFGRPLDALLVELVGAAAAGFERAARSYLDSGFFERAARTFVAAIERGGDRRAIEPLVQYSRAMTAYLVGDYANCITGLGRWRDSARERSDSLLRIARAAVSKLDQLVEGDEREQITPAAASLLERLGSPEDRAASVP